MGAQASKGLMSHEPSTRAQSGMVRRFVAAVASVAMVAVDGAKATASTKIRGVNLGGWLVLEKCGPGVRGRFAPRISS